MNELFKFMRESKYYKQGFYCNMRQKVENFGQIKKSFKSLPIELLGKNKESYEKLLKNSERKLIQMPPFEGSLQQRSYPKVLKVTESELVIIRKIGKLISAYNGPGLLREEIYRSKSSMKIAKPLFDQRKDNFKKKCIGRSYLMPIEMKKKPNLRNIKNVTPVPEMLSPWEVNDLSIGVS